KPCARLSDQRFTEVMRCINPASSSSDDEITNPESQLFTIGMYFCALPLVLCLKGLFLQAQVTDWVAPVASAVRACDRQHVRWRCAFGLLSQEQEGRETKTRCLPGNSGGMFE